MEQIVAWLVETIGKLGYPGIIALMFLESSFFPFPSEVVVPPAGYLASQGQMNIYLVVLCGILGSLLGAFFNYVIALWLGRPLLMKYGKYFFLPPERFQKVDRFFLDHGEISTFVCRLIPGIRQYISFPAGLARMNLFKFFLYTALGAGIWVVVLAWIGYLVGNNMALVKQYSNHATIVLLAGITVLLVIYIYRFLAKGKSDPRYRKNQACE
ncbi:MAG: DedA family protein [Desulfomonilia bacterium]|jgi:membrane protein DedA with SNARE-associated domain|uniref:Membrane protein DedA, SNARE-associated domain n=1 Tax=anaerobic digester metagenome TaxID=1263854 RepID=A0A485M0C5_9ZZZZ|nr:DedA family protein [Pseudomonadota bacterium]HON38389.1 DedA family protein [Deltaproteobacteria bacterium]HRS56426.1 DedA family protein [Desulfomonilia bacterium]HPD21580.1 DedA family protein [Deltaproteobacteria bacterium]HPX17238.1 DedA family protein [Deltaproteobacteria bacterium]